MKIQLILNENCPHCGHPENEREASREGEYNGNLIVCSRCRKLIKEIVYRDDDVNVYTDFWFFNRMNEIFKKTHKKHTVALLMRDIRQNYPLFRLLTGEPNVVVALHGWNHDDYSKMPEAKIYGELKKSLDYWKENITRMYGTDYGNVAVQKRIDTFFAPWNRESESVRNACARLGLKFCNVSHGDWDGKKVVSFHWWNNFRFDENNKFHVVIPAFGEETSL